MDPVCHRQIVNGMHDMHAAICEMLAAQMGVAGSKQRVLSG
jgi:hypothetical protein